VRQERGQASVEYILTLATAALFFLLVTKVFLRPLITKLATYASTRIEKVFQSSDLHRLPFRGR
jgi:hypothetical protein